MKEKSDIDYILLDKTYSQHAMVLLLEKKLENVKLINLNLYELTIDIFDRMLKNVEIKEMVKSMTNVLVKGKDNFLKDLYAIEHKTYDSICTIFVLYAFKLAHYNDMMYIIDNMDNAMIDKVCNFLFNLNEHFLDIATCNDVKFFKYFLYLEGSSTLFYSFEYLQSRFINLVDKIKKLHSKTTAKTYPYFILFYIIYKRMGRDNFESLCVNSKFNLHYLKVFDSYK
ncbi:hypothetical protein A3Q56_03340 [Intoshia linei]|uniref:Uncharacterized protein n=1 Tax=Intoshia linei TaxID=1819745 RepID=A0A177B670_9BILA|nr:hypothetical protein A3Q56_03340 [Intoshia linei]